MGEDDEGSIGEEEEGHAGDAGAGEGVEAVGAWKGVEKMAEMRDQWVVYKVDRRVSKWLSWHVELWKMVASYCPLLCVYGHVCEETSSFGCS